MVCVLAPEFSQTTVCARLMHNGAALFLNTISSLLVTENGYIHWGLRLMVSTIL